MGMNACFCENQTHELVKIAYPRKLKPTKISHYTVYSESEIATVHKLDHFLCGVGSRMTLRMTILHFEHPAVIHGHIHPTTSRMTYDTLW